MAYSRLGESLQCRNKIYISKCRRYICRNGRDGLYEGANVHGRNRRLELRRQGRKRVALPSRVDGSGQRKAAGFENTPKIWNIGAKIQLLS